MLGPEVQNTRTEFARSQNLTIPTGFPP